MYIICNNKNKLQKLVIIDKNSVNCMYIHALFINFSV